MKYGSPYKPPTVTVDAVIFQLDHGQLQVLLVKRGADPFVGHYALPGGYNALGETTLEALASKVKSKAGVDIHKDLKYIEQLYTFDSVARDPRGHAVSVTYMGCGLYIQPTNGSDITGFHSVNSLPKLAFDHNEIIKYAHERLSAKLTYTNAVYGLLPQKFTLTQLQSAYEAVFGHELDKRNFRKKFLTLDLIHETNEFYREGAHRPAKLYQFNKQEIESLTRSFD